MRRALFWLSLIVPAGALVAGLWWGSFPLGIKGEWEWSRAAPVEPVWLTFVPPVIAAGLYLGFIGLGAGRIERAGTAGIAAWLGGLVLAGFTWLWVVQESAPENYRLSKAPWVLYHRGSSGYFSEARYDERPLGEYLAGYEKKMGEGDVLHIGTHPPGLIVAFRGLLATVREFPWLADVALATEPNSAGAAFDFLEQSTRVTRSPLTPVDRAVLWLAALLVQAGAVLTVVPLYGLLRRTCTKRAAWMAAAFWPTVPALAVFLPKSDCLYPLVAMGFLWLWFRGVDRSSRVLQILAGIMFWIGMTLSLAILPVGLLAFVATVWECTRRRGDESSPSAGKPDGEGSTASSSLARRVGVGQPDCRARAVSAGAWGLAAFATLTAAMWWLVKMNLLSVWWLNFQNHAGFYREYPRTFWKWLLVNPLEFSVAAGVPLAILALWSASRQLRESKGALAGLLCGWMVVLGLLWLSGKNMGEAARLWIFLIPFLVWIAGPLFETDGMDSEERRGKREERGETTGTDFRSSLFALHSSGWAVALGIQLAATTAIVTRVVGFLYP